MIAAAPMGDPNASIPTPQPVHYRPMFGAFGRGADARARVTFVSAGRARRRHRPSSSGCERPLLAVDEHPRRHRQARPWSTTTRRPTIEVDPETYEVRADGELLTCEPADGAADGAALLPVLRRTCSRATAHRRAPAAGRRDAGRATPSRSTFDDRYRRRIALHRPTAGSAFLLDLPEARRCCATATACGSTTAAIVAVRAADGAAGRDHAPATPAQLARLAWHLGNRHLPAEIGADRILIRDDHVIAEMLQRPRRRSARQVSAPFEPEGGAYGASHDHGHPHAIAHAATTMITSTTITIITTTATTMTTTAALYRLLAWLSPAFPVGAFSYSHGLE